MYSSLMDTSLLLFYSVIDLGGLFNYHCLFVVLEIKPEALATLGQLL